MYRYAAVQSVDQFMDMGNVSQTNDSEETVVRHLCNFYAHYTYKRCCAAQSKRTMRL